MRKIYFLSIFFLGCFYCLPSMAQWDSTRLSTGRWLMGVTSAGNKALFAGGFRFRLLSNLITSQVDIFDGTTSRWTSAQLSQARLGITAISTGDIAFFAGGRGDLPALGSAVYNTVDIYTASTNQWTSATLSEERSGMAASVVGGKVLFAGGAKFLYNASDAVDIYDISTKQWTTTKLPEIFPNSIKTTTVGNTAIYDADSRDIALYDVPTGKWAIRTIPLPRRGKTVISVGTKVFLAGGIVFEPSEQFSDRVDIYDVATDQWTTAQLSEPRAYISAITVGNKIFFAGGSNNSRTVDIYDASTNQWTVAQLAIAQSNIAASTAGSKVFFASSSTGDLIVDIYDLVTNQWSATKLPGLKSTPSIANASNKVLFVENGSWPSSGVDNPGRVDIYTVNASNSFLDVSTNSVSLSATAGSTASFSVTANTGWTVRSSEIWLTPSPTSAVGNQVITLTAAVNTSIASRTALVTVSSAGLPDRILTATQAGAAPTLSVSAQRLSILADMGIPPSLTVTSNTSWSITTSASWLTTSVKSGTGTQGLSVSALANQSTSPRSATLTVTANGAPTQTVLVTQAGTLTTLAISVVSPIGVAGGVTSATVTSNASWSVSSSQAWLVASPTSGSGTAALTLTASANTQVESRTAIVSVAVDGIPSQTIIVVQAGIVILGVDNLLDETVVLYPNPVVDDLYIRGLPLKSTLSLYDSMGRLLGQQSSASPIYTLPTKTLPAGKYYLRLESNQQMTSKPFIKSP